MESTSLKSNVAFVKPEGHKRVEGADKVTGRGLYTGDFQLKELQADAMLHAVVVNGTQVGHIITIDTDAATAVPGVQAVITYKNAARLKSVSTFTRTELDSFLPLQDNHQHYIGQPVAVVVANELWQAQQAADLVKVEYTHDPTAIYSFEENLDKAEPLKKVGAGEKASVEWGKPEKAFEASAVKVDEQYLLKAAHHNPMEPAATVALWHHDGRLDVHNSTQFVYGDAMLLAQAFDFGFKDKMPRIASQVLFGFEFDNKVRVTAPLVGGGFGSKGGNANLVIAALAAKAFPGKAIKLVLARNQVFGMMPYRGATLQHVRLGADTDGKLNALLHNNIVQGAKTGGFFEPVGENTSRLYATDNLQITHQVVKLNINSPGWMRAPGASPGMFALESAMDELAHKLQLDPIELRLRNYSDKEMDSGKPWSSNALKQSYAVGAEKIGWHKRQPQLGQVIENGYHIGYGMATSMYLTKKFPALAKITLTEDGVLLQTSAQEIGQGSLTALVGITAQELQLPVEMIKIEYGDTRLPYGSMTGASSGTLSVGSAIKEAAKKIKETLLKLAVDNKSSSLYGAKEHDTDIADGYVYLKTDPQKKEHFLTLVSWHGDQTITQESSGGFDLLPGKYASSGFGAQFVKVAVHPLTGEVKVLSMVGVFGCGRIINPVTTRSQLLGGMVWGLGQALMEETVLDTTLGNWATDNLAEALVPVNKDMPEIEVIMLEEDDSNYSDLGIKGVGEIGIVGVAPAIANAIFNATGKRLRNLPIKLNQLL